jgi:hypothetical protein
MNARQILKIVLLVALLLVPGLRVTAVSPFATDQPVTSPTEIDRLVAIQLQQLGIEPAPLCSDAVFVRRVFLDVIGTVPTALEARDFILARQPNKRAQLIDALLEREEFAIYWAMKWSDLLRIKAEFPVNLWPNAAQAYHQWVHASLRENKPYDEMVRELLTASGSNFREPPVNFYRALQNKAPPDIAQVVALTFLGVRADRWPSNQLANLAAFFSQVGYKATAEWKEEIVFNDWQGTNAVLFLGQQRRATFPDGTLVTIGLEQDPREVFADWLIAPTNSWFARSFVNRAWSWFLGRGIVQEPDDLRPDNPPSNPELLCYLEREFVRSGFDVKALFRLMLNSQTYQRASADAVSPEAAAQFASYPVRRLEAEVLIDAINQITGSSEKYSSAIPEPFTFIPDGTRAVALPDGSITSSFLELFGRPARDTGLEAERNNRITAAQRLHLLNSTHIQRKIERSRLVEFQSQSRKPAREIATNLYLGILARFPTEEEEQQAASYLNAGKAESREAVTDLVWALLNNPEFLYRH